MAGSRAGRQFCDFINGRMAGVLNDALHRALFIFVPFFPLPLRIEPFTFLARRPRDTEGTSMSAASRRVARAALMMALTMDHPEEQQQKEAFLAEHIRTTAVDF